MPADALRLLALDGGGVRGLSSLMILRHLMATVDPDTPPRPCDYFDMIGSNSTGSLIAIMLGRLRMTVDESIDAYTTLSDKVFEKKGHRVTIIGKPQGRIDGAELERAAKTIVVDRGLGEDALLKDLGSPYKVFVCATSKETGDTVCLANYHTLRSDNSDLLNAATIWQACRATSAATTFSAGKRGTLKFDADGPHNPDGPHSSQGMYPSFGLVRRDNLMASCGRGNHRSLPPLPLFSPT
ncbi:acyl transferase/acyl hydrolase/lysophospholipase [Immersiella caudata]|uniref:Acyl transferase/acyl hydrolase/lysophospholipase n=1 Tax=Immersiella caudata TaxID=314043 RepID=A0AA40CAI3_9PEZI|nr:acyl transferase/acyl hydrolase/lysophospholipase [Immersiella caudata]